MKPPKAFTYYGYHVGTLEPNNSGLRYHLLGDDRVPTMRTDTKAGMKAHICENMPARRRRG